MSNNIVSLDGGPVPVGDVVRNDFLSFAAHCYDGFVQNTGAPATSFTLTMSTDDGVFDSFWTNVHSRLPPTAVLGMALGALTTAVASGVRDYDKPKD